MSTEGIIIIGICLIAILVIAVFLTLYSGMRFYKKYYAKKKYPMLLECENCGATYETDSEQWAKDFRYMTKVQRKGFGFNGPLFGLSFSYPTRYAQKRICPCCQRDAFQNIVNIEDIRKQNMNIAFYGGYVLALLRASIPVLICAILILTPLVNHFQDEYEKQHRPDLTYEDIYQQKIDAGYSEDAAKAFADEWQKKNE